MDDLFKITLQSVEMKSFISAWMLAPVESITDGCLVGESFHGMHVILCGLNVINVWLK